MALMRNLLNFSRLCTLNDFQEISKSGSLKTFPFVTSVRTGKHYDPKFKWHRSKKILPITLPHTKEFKRRRLNMFSDMGIYPRYWKERPLTIVSAVEIIDPYKPDVNDGKVSKLSGAKTLVTDTKSKLTDITAMRRIKNYERHFKTEIFLQEVQDIYIKAHTALMKNSAEELSPYVTETANEQMRQGIKRNTLRWKFIESIEPPRIVQSRIAEIITKTNLFAQVTVRFHTKQSLAIYDRFGRLMYGSEILAKDVLEYVVFEKHLNNEYGVWRLHGKIIPEWRESDAPPARTYVIKAEEEQEQDEEEEFFDEYFEAPAQPEYRDVSDVVEPEAKSSNQGVQ